MIRLAIDTSTMTQSIAVERDGECVATRSTKRRIGHSETLLTNVQHTLKELDCTIGDVDEIICGLGPGSFTGVRIGLSFALGVAAAQNVPLYGVDSMRAFLAFLPAHTPVAVALDARKSEVYGVIYANDATRSEQHPASTYAPEAFFAHVRSLKDQGVVLLGDGPDAFEGAWQTHAAHIERIPALQTPNAQGLLYAHQQGWSRAHHDQALEPRYIRPSDAEIQRK